MPSVGVLKLKNCVSFNFRFSRDSVIKATDLCSANLGSPLAGTNIGQRHVWKTFGRTSEKARPTVFEVISGCRKGIWPRLHQYKSYLAGNFESFSMRQSLTLHVNGRFPDESGLAGVYWSKGWWKWWWQLHYWSYKSCKAPVKSSPPTNQHAVCFYSPDALPVAQPTVSNHCNNVIFRWWSSISSTPAMMW